MRFHVISLPHTQTTKEYVWCAYTSKVLRFCNMMTSLGHDIFLYGGTENEAKVKEFITVAENKHNQNEVFSNWDRESPLWMEMNSNAVREISKRKEPKDFLCLIAGICQENIAKELPDMRSVEWGIGYEGIIPEGQHVFESNAWMHYIYGMYGIKDGRFFDTVIPNAFNEEDYIYKDKKEDYLLYLGRLTPRKGMEIVKELAARGHKIITAGQGDLRIPGTEHVGVVRGKEKAELLANAKALLVPTLYIEPFGGVAVEAMMSGTPVITTDFGAFTETVTDGLDGFRCHTIKEFEKAAENVALLPKNYISTSARFRFSTKEIRFKYDKYFRRLSLLDGAGWYSN